MKLFLITILLFAAAIWLGICAGHFADRHIKPFKPQIELSE